MHKTPQNSISLLESSRDSGDTADGVVLFKKTLLPQFSLMKSFPRILFSLATAAACALSANAQSVTTDPVGFVTLNIAAGTGTTKTLSILSLPLFGASSVEGQVSGKITAVNPKSFTNENAAWKAGDLSKAENPQILRITSGSASGRTFLVSTATANTEKIVTIDDADLINTDLTTLGIVVGDGYELLECDTLSGIFGSPSTTGLTAGTSAKNSDSVLLEVNGELLTYFYSSTLQRWTTSTLGSPDATNVRVRPDSAVLFSRIGNSPISLTILGKVPTSGRQIKVRNSGVTFLAQGWPAEVTLLSSGLQNSNNWTKGPNAASSDTVKFLVGTELNTYWFDSVSQKWKQQTLGSPESNSQSIPVGSGLIITQRGSQTGETISSQNPPYTLN